jgi:hypothetical protein
MLYLWEANSFCAHSEILSLHRKTYQELSYLFIHDNRSSYLPSHLITGTSSKGFEQDNLNNVTVELDEFIRQIILQSRNTKQMQTNPYQQT